jgi:hypothetical protein
LVSGYGRLLGQSLEPNENNRPAALFTTIRPLVQRPFIPLRFGDRTRIFEAGWTSPQELNVKHRVFTCNS